MLLTKAGRVWQAAALPALTFQPITARVSPPWLIYYSMPFKIINDCTRLYENKDGLLYSRCLKLSVWIQSYIKFVFKLLSRRSEVHFSALNYSTNREINRNKGILPVAQSGNFALGNKWAKFVFSTAKE